MPFQALPALAIRNPKIGLNPLERQSIEDSQTRNALAGQRLGIAEQRNSLAGRSNDIAGQRLQLDIGKDQRTQDSGAQSQKAQDAAAVTAAFLRSSPEQQAQTYPLMRQLGTEFGVELPETFDEQARLLMESAVAKVGSGSDLQNLAFPSQAKSGRPIAVQGLKGGPDEFVSPAAALGRTPIPSRGTGESDEPFRGNTPFAQNSNILIGGDPSTPEYAIAYRKEFLIPKMVQTPDGVVPIIIPAPSSILPPAGLATGGTPIAGQAIPGTKKETSTAERESLGFTARLFAASAIIEELEGLGSEIIGTVTGSENFPNLFKSSDRQRLEQAQRDFTNAKLREESGAAIADSEFTSATLQYFPVPGDKPDVVKQKAFARRQAIRNMGVSAGRALPTFESPNDAEFKALPVGSLFISAATGKIRIKSE